MPDMNPPSMLNPDRDVAVVRIVESQPERSRSGINVRFRLPDLFDSPGSVTSHGATGDGITDDSAAFAAASDAVKFWGKILIPAGTYRIASEIALGSSRVGIEFETGAKLILDAGAAVTFDGEIVGERTQIFTGSGGVALMKHQKACYPEWWGARGDGVSDDTTAFAAAFAAIRGGGILRIAGKTHLIDNNTLLMEHDGVTLRGESEHSMLKVRINNSSGRFLRVRASDILIENLQMDGNQRSEQIFDRGSSSTGINIETPSDERVIENITIQNCKIVNFSHYGIGVTENSTYLNKTDRKRTNAIHRVRMEQNQITAGTIGIEVFPKTMSTDIRVRQNHVTLTGSKSDQTGIKVNIYRDATVSGNTVIGAFSTAGIGLTTALKNCVCIGNTVTGADIGIAVNNANHAFLFDGPPIDSMTITGNRIQAKEEGIFIGGNFDFAGRLRVTRNEINAPKAILIHPFDAATGTLANQVYLKNVLNGLVVVKSSPNGKKRASDIQFLSNHFQSGSAHMHIENADHIRIHKNEFRSAPRFGIQANGATDLILSENLFENIGHAAVALFGCDGVELSKNRFVNCNRANAADVHCVQIGSTLSPSHRVTVRDNRFRNPSGKQGQMEMDVAAGCKNVRVVNSGATSDRT